MSNAAQRSSVVLPVLLAVIGVALLATAVMLVPVIIRTSVAQISSTLPQPPAAGQPGQATQPSAQAVVRQTPPTASGDASTAAGDAGAEGTALPSWTLNLDPKSYTLDDASSAALDQIVTYMQTNPGAKLALNGVNNPMRSSKRAKQAARRVKEMLIESGVERYRVTVEGIQEDGARGLVVRAEIAEDAR